MSAVFALATASTVHVSDAAEQDPLAHLRLTLDSTSDWSTAELAGVEVLATRVTPGPGDDRAYLNGAALTVVGTAPSTANVDLLVRVSDAVELRLDKGYDGDASVTVERLDPDRVVVHRLEDHLHEGDNQALSSSLAPQDLIGDGSAIPVVDSRRLTLAFYYPWWTEGSMSGKPLVDRPSSAWRTDEPDDVNTMVDEAADAGISGFLVSWSGEQADGAEFDLVMDAAETRGDFVTGALLELLPYVRTDLLGRSHLDVAAAAESARAALARASRPGYLHVGDQPILAVFGVDQVSQADWQALRDAIASANPFLLGDSTDPSRRLDGAYLYDPTQPSAAELQARYEAMYHDTHLAPVVQPDLPTRLFAATVAPGKSMSLSRPTSGRGREGGARYDRLWQLATASQPEWILITSWNEWYEGTYIAPSTVYGRLALDQTAGWTAHFGS